MKLFNLVKGNKYRKNNFDLRHDRKFSLNMGGLYPFFCEEVVPNDTWYLRSECMLRFAPLVAPVMHNINVHMHYFFVPNRIIWDEWQTFLTGADDGEVVAAEDMPIHPYFRVNAGNANLFGAGTLCDYLGYNLVGLPSTEQRINALPMRAYAQIYNDYYRDQNLDTKIQIDKGSGDQVNGAILLPIQKRAWEKDYFTSCLPWAQKGGQVQLPLGGQAPLTYEASDEGTFARRADTGAKLLNISGDYILNDEEGIVRASASNAEYHQADLDVTNSHFADLSEATAASINDLRRATKLQEWLEKNARGGSRYIESILHHFGVRSSDARLQRAEFLGGYKNPVVISEVLQQSGSPTDSEYTSTPLGEMGGHGISVGSGRPIKKFCEEHGYIIGIMSVIPRTAYQQGLRRSWFRFDNMDYYWPEFAHLGEQEVFNKEVYNNFDADTENGTFGYQSRYAEYKYIPSSVHGDFKNSLDFWHLGRQFDNKPSLNSEFIKCDPRTDCFAVQDDGVQKLWCQVFNDVKANRLMPKFGTPNL